MSNYELLTPTEKYILKKFGPKQGIKLINKLSKSEIKNTQHRIKFSQNMDDLTYEIELFDLKDNELGKINYNIFTEDPKYIRMAFEKKHNMDDTEVLNIMLQFIDEIAMKIEAKVIDTPYPIKTEIAVYRQHKYEPFTDHPKDKSDYIYNKYDVKHCKTNILGLFDNEIEND